MDRETIARERRRRQALEQLELERDREAALREQLAEVIGEQLEAEVDEAAFARMSADDVAVVREALVGVEDETELFDDDWLADDDDEEAAAEDAEPEIARLQAEVEDSRRRQAAFEAYLAALAVTPPSEPGPRAP